MISKKCEKHKGTLMVSEETLLIILPAILSDPEVFIYKIERCDMKGWHIYCSKDPEEVLLRKKKKKARK